MIEADKKYQWIKGEYFGIIETVIPQEFENEVTDMIHFQSGRSIYKSVLDEFMVDATNSPMLPATMLPSTIQQIGSNQPQTIKSAEPVNVSQVSNQRQLLLDAINKSKRNTTIALMIPITITLPQKEVCEFLKDLYGDLVDEVFLESIIKNSISEIEEYLKDWFNKNYKNG